MKPLNTLDFPLTGQSLIEASAGTGKTYTISNLFLRLIIGHFCEPQSVEKVLIVTFTNAATNELKERLQKRLQQAHFAFQAGHSDDDFIQQLIEDTEDKTIALQRLLVAQQAMDNAAIFTIHGFCQRSLLEHAFESGALYEQKLMLDEYHWLQEAIQDFWRGKISQLSANEMEFVLGLWATPEQLLQEIRPHLYRSFEFAAPTYDEWQQALSGLASEVEQVKRWWLENRLQDQFTEAELKANVALAKAPYINAFEDYCHSSDLNFLFGKWGFDLFTPDKVIKAHKKGREDLLHLDFSVFESLVEQLAQGWEIARNYWFSIAVSEVNQGLAKLKQQNNLLSPDDLLVNLQQALKNTELGEQLSDTILAQYPIAMVDEFQDTDPIQFDIFSQIYMRPQGSLILIGDPKQAIYGFRGGDIFTYIEAKKRVDQERQFTLTTNWRSQHDLVDANNIIFSSSDTGFIYKQAIPFLPTAAAKSTKTLTSGDGALASFRFCHLPQAEDGKYWSRKESNSIVAQHFANEVSGMLSGPLKVDEQPIAAGDICILVRDRIEAQLMKDALALNRIDSVFLAKRSVFNSEIAYQLYLVLKALYQPKKESAIKSALLSEMFGLQILEFDALLSDDWQWQKVLSLFHEAHKIWMHQGVLSGLELIFQFFSVYELQVKYFEDGQRRLTDLRHLGELLQQQSSQLRSAGQLLQWYEEQLSQPDDQHDAQQLRLESDSDLVQITTIHASKGLQYPIVLLPFANNYREANHSVFHDEQGRLVLDFSPDVYAQSQIKKEQLAEDIRLLYVALTRAEFHISVGIWNNAKANRRKGSGFVDTALGHLLMGTEQSEISGDTVDDTQILQRLSDLQSQADIGIETIVHQQTPNPYNGSQSSHSSVSVARLNRDLVQHWQLTSYSAISAMQHAEDTLIEVKGQDDKDSETETVEDSELEKEALDLPRFNFVKGANAGSYLHGVLEFADWQDSNKIESVSQEQALRYGLTLEDVKGVPHWMREVLHTPMAFGGTVFNLAEIEEQHRLPEMEFYMPVEKLKATSLNDWLKAHLPEIEDNFHFEDIKGMVKGFIDLVVFHQGRYYVMDYKSNHLGYSFDDYSQEAMFQAMQEHNYHLQAVFYSLALHRYLANCLPDYNYEQHVAGAGYLFLRGMHPQHSPNGLFYTRPSKQAIEELDALFSQNEDAVSMGEGN